MKIVIRTVLFHIICIIIFGFLYLYFAEHFNSNNVNKKYNTVIDYVLLSTTIQAGVGISDLFPITYYSKLIMIVQQLLMIFTHIFTLYVFTL